MNRFVIAFAVVLCATTANASMLLVTQGEIEAGITIEKLIEIRGEPQSKTPPIGYPAASRWTYADGTIVVVLEGRVVDAFIPSE